MCSMHGAIGVTRALLAKICDTQQNPRAFLRTARLCLTHAGHTPNTCTAIHWLLSTSHSRLIFCRKSPGISTQTQSSSRRPWRPSQTRASPAWRRPGCASAACSMASWHRSMASRHCTHWPGYACSGRRLQRGKVHSLRSRGPPGADALKHWVQALWQEGGYTYLDVRPKLEWDDIGHVRPAPGGKVVNVPIKHSKRVFDAKTRKKVRPVRRGRLEVEACRCCKCDHAST